jgi:hypothetical protein
MVGNFFGVFIMEIHRTGNNSFDLFLTNSEVEAFERYACENEMECKFFIKWLFMTGLKIFSLTVEGKESCNELEGKD